MIGEIVAAHRFMVVVVSCAQFSCGGGGGGIAFTLLDNCKATIDGQEIRSSVITPSTTVSKWIENERFISIDDSFISIDDSFISIDENRSHIDSHVFFVVEMVILSSYAHYNVEMDE